MAKGQPITEIEIEHTLLMASYGLAARDIANILKRGPQSVYRILRRYGVAARPAERTEDQHLEANRLLHRLLHGIVPVIEPEPVEPEPLDGYFYIADKTEPEPPQTLGNWAARIRASVKRVIYRI